MAPLSGTRRSLKCLVTTANHLSTTSLSQVSSSFSVVSFTQSQIRLVVMFCSLVLQSKLTCVCALCRMSADEDRATQAQYVCHPMPAVDLGYWTNFPRRQQWGKVNGWNFVLRLCDKDAVTVHLWQIIQSNHRSFQFEHHSKKYTYQSLRFLLMQNFPIIYIDISIYLYIYIKHCREWILKNLLINRKPWIKLIATNYYLKIISMWNHIPNC